MFYIFENKSKNKKNMENSTVNDKIKFWQELKVFLEIFFPANSNYDDFKEMDSEIPEYIDEIVSEFIANQEYACLCIPFINDYEIAGNFYMFFPEFSENNKKNHEMLTGLKYNKSNNEEIAFSLSKPITIIYQNIFSSNPRIDDSFWLNKVDFANLYNEKQKFNKNFFYKTFFRWNFSETANSDSLFYGLAMDSDLLNYLISKENKLKKGGISNFIKLSKRESNVLIYS
jgi:hypothetical protein